MAHEPTASRTSSGFTLVEVLITLVILGIVGAATIGVLLRQNSFYGQNDDVVFANQNVRGAADLVPSELRTISGADVTHSKSDSLQVRYDVWRGVVCSVNSGTVDYYVFDRDDNTNLPAGRGTAYRNPFGDSIHVYDDGLDAYNNILAFGFGGPRENCETAGAPDDGNDEQYRRVDWATASSEPVPEQGAYLRGYGFLSYHFKDSSFGDGEALWRNSDELIAPFEPGSAEFEYQVCNPGCAWYSNVSDNSEQRQLSRFRILGKAVGEGTNRHDVARDLRLDISLRN